MVWGYSTLKTTNGLSHVLNLEFCEMDVSQTECLPKMTKLYAIINHKWNISLSGKIHVWYVEVLV